MIVHCIHGKGRTGTAICAYLMYSMFAASAQDAIAYFRFKRYPNTNKGVQLPMKGMKHTC